jgi:hypothetical protein
MNLCTKNDYLLPVPLEDTLTRTEMAGSLHYELVELDEFHWKPELLGRVRLQAGIVCRV